MIQSITFTITANPKNAAALLAALEQMDGGTQAPTQETANAPAPVASAPRGRGRPPKQAAPALDESDESEETETESFDGLDDDAEETTPTMSLDELRKGLKEIGKPDAIMKMFKTKFKVGKLTDLDSEQYAEALAAARKLK
jgi:hypothetical protein